MAENSPSSAASEKSASPLGRVEAPAPSGEGSVPQSGIGRRHAVTIVFDDRERDPDLIALLSEREDVCLVRGRLEAGDYLVDGRVIFERKTAMDFGRSLVDGRLFRQAARMIDAPGRPAIILQGNAREWQATGIRREALQGALITLTLVFDLPVFRAMDADEAARILVYAGKQMMRLRTGGARLHQHVKAKRKITRQRKILESLPGIGASRAQALLEHFGSVEACISASESELAAVPGIGPGTAQGVRSVVSEDPAAWHMPHREAWHPGFVDLF
jgi:DNA excision repair protein ERCC-4